MPDFLLTVSQATTIRRIADHLEGSDVPDGVDLTEASVLPGWWIQKDRSRKGLGAVYGVTTPEDRHPEVTWAYTPVHRFGDRPWLIKLLREHWLDEARRYLGEMP